MRHRDPYAGKIGEARRRLAESLGCIKLPGKKTEVEMTDRNLDAEFAANSEREYQYGFDIRARRFLLSRWDGHISKEGKSLEMGSFDGSMTDLLLEKVDILDVVEGSAELAGRLRASLGARVTVFHDWFEEFVPVTQYDQIFLVHGLEHVENPISVLERAASWLKPNGKLFVAVPNANALSRQLAVKMGLVESPQAVTPGERLHGHLRTYNLDTLLSDFVDAKLTVIESGGVILKALSNSQFDAAFAAGIVTDEYLQACDDLSKTWPDFSASVFAVATL